jgi:tyrosine decarboxylase/aspartate 1-decarboxylase
MPTRVKGRSKKEILAELLRIHDEDVKYGDGRVLCSMCTTPHPIAKIAHRLFLSSNLGDPGLFAGSRRLEKEAVRNLGTLLNCKDAFGFIVSGGTEANLLAMWVARNTSRIAKPEIVVPESAHFSFNKICNLLSLKLVRASCDSRFRVDPDEVERCITRNTVAIVGTAGTAELGAIDPIRALSEIALAHGVFFHVDAALGGLMIPFLENANEPDFKFDFQLEGVSSMTVDPHKMGMSTIPAGGILFRDRRCLDVIKTNTPYLTDDAQYTFVGTRSGAPVAATWAVFEALGREGFVKVVSHCMNLTRFLSEGIELLGLELVTKPTLNVLAFRCTRSKLLAEGLRKRGWFVSYVPRLDCIRIIVMPHLKRKHAEAFLRDLREIARPRVA